MPSIQVQQAIVDAAKADLDAAKQTLTNHEERWQEALTQLGFPVETRPLYQRLRSPIKRTDVKSGVDIKFTMGSLPALANQVFLAMKVCQEKTDEYDKQVQILEIKKKAET